MVLISREQAGTVQYTFCTCRGTRTCRPAKSVTIRLDAESVAKLVKAPASNKSSSCPFLALNIFTLPPLAPEYKLCTARRFALEAESADFWVSKGITVSGAHSSDQICLLKFQTQSCNAQQREGFTAFIAFLLLMRKATCIRDIHKIISMKSDNRMPKMYYDLPRKRRTLGLAEN